MVKAAYITLMGRSGWAVVNSFHASVIETDFRPEQIVVLYESQYSDDVKPVVEGLMLIQETYTSSNVVTVEVPDWDAHTAGKKAKEIVDGLKRESFGVALDITGGRKALVAGALLALKDEDFDRVFYLAIETTEDVAKPYLLISKRIQTLFDITKNEAQNETISFESETGSVDLIMNRASIMILLNMAYTRGEKILLRAPLIRVDLLELDLDNQRITMQTDRRNYESHLNNAFNDWDHPTYSDLRRCLCYCGALDYKNSNSFLKLLERDLSDSHNLGVSRKAVLALDSNMFYNGFPTYLERNEKRLGLKSKDVHCVTPFPVKKEIRKNINQKYRSGKISDAKRHYRSKSIDHLLDEFIGQNTFPTRLAKMAKAQLLKLKSRPVHVYTENVKLPPDKEEVDHLIVDTLEQFAQEKNVRIFLTSSDKNMLDHCDLADDVHARILEFPADIPRTLNVDDETAVNLLVGISLLYGVIELKGVGYIFGEYRGKQSDVYTEEVKLRLRNLHRARLLQERVEICDRISKHGVN